MSTTKKKQKRVQIPMYSVIFIMAFCKKDLSSAELKCVLQILDYANEYSVEITDCLMALNPELVLQSHCLASDARISPASVKATLRAAIKQNAG